MISELIDLFGGVSRRAEDEGGQPSGRDHGLRLAVAALLIEAAEASDGVLPEERAAIRRVLERQYGLGAAAVEELMREGQRASAGSVQLFRFTQIINERTAPAERIALIEMLWEVALADGRLDPLEDTLLRRIGGLIDVPDRERGAARRRVMRRLGLGAAADTVT
jgi:uncharacterized tellurite resistance protein B-like protein